jgi:hypothetical protein
MSNLNETIRADRSDFEQRAWEALSRYKFWMFGYWAACWVHANRYLGGGPCAFKEIVDIAKSRVEKRIAE